MRVKIIDLNPNKEKQIAKMYVLLTWSVVVLFFLQVDMNLIQRFRFTKVLDTWNNWPTSTPLVLLIMIIIITFHWMNSIYTKNYSCVMNSLISCTSFLFSRLALTKILLVVIPLHLTLYSIHLKNI